MSQVSTVYVEGTIFSCVLFSFFCWTLYPDRPYGTFAKSNSHIRLGKSPEKKKNVTRTPASLLISSAAAIVYKQLQLLLLRGLPLWRWSAACCTHSLPLSQQKLPPQSSCLFPLKAQGLVTQP